MHCKVWYW